MKNLSLIAITLCIAFFSNPLFAQNGVKISNATGTADPSAMLDVVSTSKGVLIPRMTAAQRSPGIANPANGLLVYQTDGTPGYYYNAGTPSVPNWIILSAGAFSGVGTLNYLDKWTGSNTFGASQVYDNGTNVGIGTAAPNSKLEIINTIGHTYPTPGLTYGSMNIAPLPGAAADQSASLTFGAAQSVAGAQAGIYVQSSGSYGTKMYFGTTNSYATGSQVRMMIDHAGNVGIGTVLPGAKLEVNGSSGSTIKIVDGNQAAGKVLTSDANGQGSWKSPGTPAITTVVAFAYTGTDQTWTVPGGVTSIQVDLYGAAGGNGSWGGWNYGWTGGAGGYTHGTVAVTPGQVLTIIVGQGGAGGATSNATNSYGGGGHNCTSSDCQYAAKGGGRSAIRNASAVEILTAGGGGGGGSCVSIGNSLRMCGGAGGGLVGNNSINEYSGQVATGGTQTAGGTGMTGNVRTGTNGSQFTGGSPGGAESYGGGGGGGWYGGGGGNYYTNAMGGGAGGSGYISGPGVTGAWTVTGGGAQPEGAASMGSSNWPYFGRNGSVIISY